MNKCIVCKNTIIIPNYNMDHDHSKYSNSSFRTVLECIFAGQIDLGLICNICVDLLNDFDEAQIICNRLKQRILSYFELDNINSKISFKDHAGSKLDDTCLREELLVRSDRVIKDLYKCQFCYQNFFILDDLSLHIAKLHSKGIDVAGSSKNFVLKKCGGSQIVNQNSECRNINACLDIQNQDSVKLENYKCTFCPKTFSTKNAVSDHFLTHTTVKQFICEICGQEYKNKAALEIHVGMHNGIHPFICIHCKKSFTQKGALQRHFRIHTGETPFQCDLCGKRFIHRTSFNIHQLFHSGQKEYKCSDCDLAFISRSHLNRHIRIHTGERNYACSLCGKRFAERYNLYAHEKLHMKVCQR